MTTTKRAERDLVTLYRPTWSKRDATTGEMVAREAATWWVVYREDGRRRRENLRLDRKADAEIAAKRIAERLRAKALGILKTPDALDELRALPLSRHLLAFRATLRGRGGTRKHVRHTLDAIVRRDRPNFTPGVLRAMRATSLSDLDLGAASARLVEMTRKGYSARTVNRYAESCRAFGRFLVATRRTAFDPFAGLRPLNVAEDRRRVRRAFTPAEFAALLDATVARPLAVAEACAAREAARRAAGESARRTAAEVTPDEGARLRALGEARASLYRFLEATGLRRGEVGRLAWSDVLFDRAEVVVQAASAKARRRQEVPLRADVVAMMRTMRDARKDEPVSAPVFPSRTIPTARGFRLDLEAAGIAPRDAEGQVLDLHALRTTLATRLSDANVPIVQAQKILRHSTPALTANVYTRPASSDLRAAVERAGEASSRLSKACPNRVRKAVSVASPGPNESSVAVGPEVACDAENATKRQDLLRSGTSRPGSSTGQSSGFLIRAFEVAGRGLTGTCDGAAVPACPGLVQDGAAHPLALARELLDRAAALPAGDVVRDVLVEKARALLAPPTASTAPGTRAAPSDASEGAGSLPALRRGLAGA